MLAIDRYRQVTVRVGHAAVIAHIDCILKYVFVIIRIVECVFVRFRVRSSVFYLIRNKDNAVKQQRKTANDTDNAQYDLFG